MKVLWIFARFPHGLEMCMWFGYNPWLNFCPFFHFVNFVIFWPQVLWKCIDSGYLVNATPYTISCLSLCNFAHLFFHGLKMCMWFGFNRAVNFCQFCNLLTLSFFAGATSTSPKFVLYFHFVNLVIFLPQCIDSGYLVSATPHTILYQSFWNFAHVFSMSEDVHVVWI